MPVASNPDIRVVFYEGNGSEPLLNEDRFASMRSLLDAGYAATRATEGGYVTPADTRDMIVLGRFEDESANDADAAPCGGGDIKMFIRNIDGQSPDNMLQTVESIRDELKPDGASAWKPWFPVIDFDRCTNCMQCLSFCLFDVYGTTSEGEIQVQNEDNCKTDCPACSRVCPEVAILFPKYRFGPINGDEISQEDVNRESMKVDISSLLGGDIYAALRDRSEKAKSRFSKERDEDKALKERQRCLTKLAQNMDIPAEVMMSLPSAQEIQQKAQEAQEKARIALEENEKREG